MRLGNMRERAGNSIAPNLMYSDH